MGGSQGDVTVMEMDERIHLIIGDVVLSGAMEEFPPDSNFQ